jgi:hypothetical protein
LRAIEPSRFALHFKHFLKLKKMLLAAPAQPDELRLIAGIIGHQSDCPFIRLNGFGKSAVVGQAFAPRAKKRRKFLRGRKRFQVKAAGLVLFSPFVRPRSVEVVRVRTNPMPSAFDIETLRDAESLAGRIIPPKE